jgi:hypothetical protein
MEWRNSLEHIPRNGSNATKRRLAGHRRRLLQPSLDRINRRIREGTHCSRYQADDGRLVGRDGRVGVLGLPFLEEFFEFRVCGEVHCLVGPWFSFVNTDIQTIGCLGWRWIRGGLEGWETV